MPPLKLIRQTNSNLGLARPEIVAVMRLFIPAFRRGLPFHDLKLTRNSRRNQWDWCCYVP